MVKYSYLAALMREAGIAFAVVGIHAIHEKAAVRSA
jgi:hypothetical protein